MHSGTSGLLAGVAAFVGCGIIAGCNPSGELLTPGQVHSLTFATHAATDTSCHAIVLTPKLVADSTVLTFVLWSSSDSSVATPDSIGRVIGYAPGTALIRARASFDTTKFDTVRVTVVDPSGPFVLVTNLRQAGTGQPAQLTSVHDSVDVGLDVTPPGCRRKASPRWVRADITIANAYNSLTKSFAYNGGIGGAVLVRVNTAQTDSTTGLPRLPNGNYSITASVTDTAGVVSRSPNALAITIANP